MFVKSTLHSLGLRVQLGHGGAPCPNPSNTARRVVVCDYTGIFEHRVYFCKCQDDTHGTTTEWRQFMQIGWFPATMDAPATASTFRLLDTFQELNLQGKMNLHDYWKTIERITDNSGGRDVPVSKSHQTLHIFLLSHSDTLPCGTRIDTSRCLML